MLNSRWYKSSSNQNSENSYGGLFLFYEPFKMIPCLQKSHHPFLRYEIWSLYIEYLKKFHIPNTSVPDITERKEGFFFLFRGGGIKIKEIKGIYLHVINNALSVQFCFTSITKAFYIDYKAMYHSCLLYSDFFSYSPF